MFFSPGSWIYAQSQCGAQVSNFAIDQDLVSRCCSHSDVKLNNVMMDFTPLCDEPVHPADLSYKRDYSGRAKPPRDRTLRPVKYYHIDFGHASRHKVEDGPPQKFIGNGYGGDLSVPEFKTQEYCDPFPVDVYRVGNIIRMAFTHVSSIIYDLLIISDLWWQGPYGKKRGFEFMEPLLHDMCQDDPTKRPKMNDVVFRFAKIVRGLSSYKLRSRVIDAREARITRLLYVPTHWATQFGRIIRRIPAIPAA